MLTGGNAKVLVGAKLGSGGTLGVGFGGTVTKVGECLGIDSWTVVWPYGTTITSEDPLTIDVPGEGRISVGDTVDGGGDVSTNGDSANFGAIPSGCPGDRVVEYYPNH
jgi:hypothetical protein